MRVTPDYTESLSPLVEGVYACRILICEPKTSQNGNRYLSWKLETIREKRTVFYITMVEGKGVGMLNHFLKCALSEYQDGEFDTDDVIGKVVMMELGIKEIQNKSGQMSKVYHVKNVDRYTSISIDEDLPF